MSGTKTLPPTPARDAVLTPDQLAAWLQVSVDTALGANLPSVPFGKRQRRYVVGQVLEALAERAE